MRKKTAKKRTRPVVTQVPRTLKGSLRLIDLMLGATYGYPLAAVLRALRGPDNENHVLKERTTAHVRHAAFPRHGTRLGSTYAGLVIKRGHPGADQHFLSSVRKAAEVLGILK